MEDESVSARMDRFRSEIEDALIRDADNRIAGFAAEYNILPETVQVFLPRIYLKVGIEVELKRAGCTDEQINGCVHHVYMLLNGIKQRAEDVN